MAGVKRMSFELLAAIGNNWTSKDAVGCPPPCYDKIAKSARRLSFRRRTMRRDWSFGFVRGLALYLALGVALTASPAAVAADAATNAASASSRPIAQNLRHILDGAAPKGVSDLRAMQDHVQGLVDQLKKCTVGVQVGPAWGSGVIISKDGYVLTAAHVAEAGRNRGSLDGQGAAERPFPRLKL